MRVLGLDPFTKPNEVQKRVGIQLQSSAYFPHLRLGELLELFGRLYPKRLDPDQLLSRVGLFDKRRALVGELSGGQAQRFAIVAALVNDPDVVFLGTPQDGLWRTLDGGATWTRQTAVPPGRDELTGDPVRGPGIVGIHFEPGSPVAGGRTQVLVVGSWLWCVEMIMSTVVWKRDNPGKVVPLAMYGTTANAIMWLWTSAGVGIEMLFHSGGELKAPPPETVFLHRKLVGSFLACARIRARVRVQDLIQRHL